MGCCAASQGFGARGGVASVLGRLLGRVGPGVCVSRAAAAFPQVFSEIRNEHFSSVFGFLSQKSRNLQAQYDVSVPQPGLGDATLSLTARPQPRALPPQRRRGMDIKQMKDFVSQELKGLKQEHRLLSLRRSLRGGRGPRLCCKCWSSGESRGSGGPGCAQQRLLVCANSACRALSHLLAV